MCFEVIVFLGGQGKSGHDIVVYNRFAVLRGIGDQAQLPQVLNEIYRLTGASSRPPKAPLASLAVLWAAAEANVEAVGKSKNGLYFK